MAKQVAWYDEGMSNGEGNNGNPLGKFLEKHDAMTPKERHEAAKPPPVSEASAIQEEVEEISAKNFISFEDDGYSFSFSSNSPEAITPSDRVLVKKDFLTFFKSFEWDNVFPKSLDQPISIHIVFKRAGVLRYSITVDRGGGSSQVTTREIDIPNKKP